MSASHDNLTQVTVILDAPPIEQFGFDRIAVFRNTASASFLGGLRFKDYSTVAEVTAAVAASELDSTTGAYLVDMFGQNPAPASIRVVAVDTTVPETPEDAWDDLVALPGGLNFYAVHMLWTSAGGGALTEVTDLLAKIVARKLGFLVVDAGETTLYSGTLAASTMNIVANQERVALVYNDSTAAEGHGNCILARMLAFNPDIRIPAFKGPLAQVTGLTTPITPTNNIQLDANNVNVVLPGFGVQTYFAKGVMLDGRQIRQVYIADWLKVRLTTDLQALMLDYDIRGDILDVSSTGLEIVRSVILARLELAEQAQGLKPGQYVITSLTGDVNTGIISAVVNATNTTAAVGFDVTIYLTRNDVVTT